jgi:hypothetical protein
MKFLSSGKRVKEEKAGKENRKGENGNIINHKVTAFSALLGIDENKVHSLANYVPRYDAIARNVIYQLLFQDLRHRPHLMTQIHTVLPPF